MWLNLSLFSLTRKKVYRRPLLYKTAVHWIKVKDAKVADSFPLFAFSFHQKRLKDQSNTVAYLRTSTLHFHSLVIGKARHRSNQITTQTICHPARHQQLYCFEKVYCCLVAPLAAAVVLSTRAITKWADTSSSPRWRTCSTMIRRLKWRAWSCSEMLISTGVWRGRKRNERSTSWKVRIFNRKRLRNRTRNFYDLLQWRKLSATFPSTLNPKFFPKLTTHFCLCLQTLQGLLPAGHHNQSHQARLAIEQIREFQKDLNKYIYLRDLQDNNKQVKF